MSTEDLQLVSPNGWVSLILQGDGNLVLYRTQVDRQLWASNTAGQLVSRVVMEGAAIALRIGAEGGLGFRADLSMRKAGAADYSRCPQRDA